MNIYKHTGKGHWIGSVVIVQAKTFKEAVLIIRKELDANGLISEKLNIQVVTTQIIHVDNGDY